MPRISVIIPARNAAATLDAQLTALAPQVARADAEVLLADNGSTDATITLARSWQARLPRLRIVDASARPGPAAARNIAVSHAHGRDLAFCDADDVVGEHWLVGLAHALETHAAVAGALDFSALNPRSGGMGTAGAFPVRFLPGLWAGGTGNLGVRAAAFRELRGFDEELRVGEDIDLCCRLQLAGHPLQSCPEAVVHVRLRGGVLDAWRHAFAFGAADRQLRHRYAAVAAALRSGQWAPPSGPAVAVRADPSPGPAARRPLSLRRVDPTAAARRSGRWWGERIGRIDRTLPQLAPPQRDEPAPA